MTTDSPHEVACRARDSAGTPKNHARTDWERRIHRRLTETTEADPASELPAPAWLAAAPGSGFVRLPWSPVRGAAGYVLERGRADGDDEPTIVADEPVSMLAGVLRLLEKPRRDRGLSLLHITRDLLSARVVTDRILVLNQGKVVEHGGTKDVLQQPQDDSTVALLDAVAAPHP